MILSLLLSVRCFSWPGLWWLKAGWFCSALCTLKLQQRLIDLCKVAKISLNVGAKHKTSGFDSGVYRGAATTATPSRAVTAWGTALQTQALVRWKESRTSTFFYTFSGNFVQGTSLQTQANNQTTQISKFMLSEIQS